MTKTLIIPDLHGNVSVMKKMLRNVGAIDDSDNRVEGWYIVQLGDALNCVKDSIKWDEDMLEALPKYVDKYLVGNHESPYIVGNDCGFVGFYDHPPIGTELRRMYREGFLMAAHDMDNILVTHAGVTRDFHWTNAQMAADVINSEWQTNPKNKMFTEWDGVLWTRFEPKNKYFSQVFGHTPGSTVRIKESNTTFEMCLDLGAKASINPRLAVAVYENKQLNVYSTEEEKNV